MCVKGLDCHYINLFSLLFTLRYNMSRKDGLLESGSRGRVCSFSLAECLDLAVEEEGHRREFTCVIARVSEPRNGRLSGWCWDAPLGWLRRRRWLRLSIPASRLGLTIKSKSPFGGGKPRKPNRGLANPHFTNLYIIGALVPVLSIRPPTSSAI